MNVLEFIKSKTRDEWYNEAREIWVGARIWIQEHGELAAGLAFVGGVIIVTFAKLFLFLLAVGVIASFIVFQLAPEQAPQQPSDEHTEENPLEGQ